MKEKSTYIYRITDKSPESRMPARYIYAVNKSSAKRWQVENCPEIRAEITCIGIKKVPIADHAQEFNFAEYQTINHQISIANDPEFWKKLIDKT